MKANAGSPLAKKLGIASGDRVALLGAPEAFRSSLHALPDKVKLLRSTRKPLDMAVLFVTRRSELLRRLPTTKRSMNDAGQVWIAWPKGTSGVVTDLRDADVREIGFAHGMVENKVTALDDMWSGVRFVLRHAAR